MDWKPEKDTDSGKIVSKYGLTQSGLRSLFCFLLLCVSKRRHHSGSTVLMSNRKLSSYVT